MLSCSLSGSIPHIVLSCLPALKSPQYPGHASLTVIVTAILEYREWRKSYSESFISNYHGIQHLGRDLFEVKFADGVQWHYAKAIRDLWIKWINRVAVFQLSVNLKHSLILWLMRHDQFYLNQRDILTKCTKQSTNAT